MPVRWFTNPEAFFEPETVALMSEAFEAACKMLLDAGQLEAVREVIAKRVIAAVSIGERDPVRLRAAALAGCQTTECVVGHSGIVRGCVISRAGTGACPTDFVTGLATAITIDKKS